MKTKRRASRLLAATLAVSLLLPAYAGLAGPGPFRTDAVDLSGHWARGSMENWMARGVLSGYPDGELHPDAAMTRAEFAAMMNRIFGFYAEADEPFADAGAEDWYAKPLQIAKQAGYLQGAPGNKALPSAPLTRQDAVVVLARLFSMEGEGGATGYTDDAEIADYARSGLKALSGIVSGYEDGNFRPNAAVTRAEAAVLLERLAAGYYSEAGTFEGGSINGNVIVNRAGADLRNTVVSGNLYLAAGIGDGNLRLEGVQVKGKVYVSGGGRHTVTFHNSTLGDVQIDRKEGPVRLALTGDTRIGSIAVLSPSGLELGTGVQVNGVTAAAPLTLSVAGQARIGQLTVAAAGQGSTISLAGEIGQAVFEADGIMVNGTLIARGGSLPQPANPAVVAGGGGGSTDGGIDDSSGGGTGGGTGGETGGGEHEPEVPAVNLVDPDATPETRSLFAYLQERMGQQVIFGQQGAMSEGVTITVKDGTQSDTLNAVGDFPGVFGFDVQNLAGTNYEANRDRMLMLMKAAYNAGGILTVSSHSFNIATGGDYNDTTGNPVPRILPGGDKNAAYNDFLDRVAELAGLLTDENGTPIPLIYRPYHEQNGSWFWWGAAYRSNEQFIELYRYTIEYLRDIKGVHNFLYAYSPNSPFGGSEQRYLESYPGDEYVDVLGFDSYYNGTSPTWYDNAIQDAKLVSAIASQRNKIPAFTEFGYKYIDSEGKDPQFYTKLLNALKQDPDARKISYMMTWVNWSAASAYVPYRDGPNGLGDHPLLPDFTEFYEDSFTAFRNEVRSAHPYQQEATVVAEQPFLHVVAPTENLDVPLSKATTIRVRILHQDIQRVVYSVDGDPQEYPMTPDAQGFYYVADWMPAAAFAESEVTLTVSSYGNDGTVLTQKVKVYVSDGTIVNPLIIDTFEGYRGKDELLRGTYGSAGDVNTISLDPVHKISGNYGVKYDYNVGTGYTGRTKNMNQANWSEANKLTFWMESDGSDQKLVIQINAGGIAFEAYPSLAENTSGMVEIPFSQFKPAAWNTVNFGKVITKKALQNVKAFSIYVNRNPDVPGTSGTLYFDEIRVVNDPSLDPVPYDQQKLYGFEDGTTQGFEITNDTTVTAGGLSVADAVYRSGEHSLTTAFSLAHAADPTKQGLLQLRKKGPMDLTGYKEIVARFMIVPDAGAQLKGQLSALLYTQSGPTWGTYTFKQLNNIPAGQQGGFVEIVLPIAAVPDIAQTQALGLKIFVPAGSTGNAAIYLDDVEIR